MIIKQIIWPSQKSGDLVSPFQQGKGERTLRLTFHCQSFHELPTLENEALQVLLELSNLPEIFPVQTEQGDFSFLEIGQVDPIREYVEITLHKKGGTVHSGIHTNQLFHFDGLPISLGSDKTTENRAKEELLILAAHVQLKQDILITASNILISQNNSHLIERANVMKPSEAVKLVGLFLRSRGISTLCLNNNGRFGVDQGLFYWDLMRGRLPNLGTYFSACVEAENIRHDGIIGLGQSVLERAKRALQARDAIGRQFYIPQNNNVADEILYHFDYLTLNLTGALDAQARICYRVYQTPRLNEWNVNFRKSTNNGGRFLTALQNAGANDLYNLLSENRNSGVIDLLFTLRNTIHGEGLKTIGYREMMKPERSFAIIPSSDQQVVLNTTVRWGEEEKWGIKQLHELCIEPYSFTVTLVEECFRLINNIAAVTDITRLFPMGYDISRLAYRAPENEPFSRIARERIEILG